MRAELERGFRKRNISTTIEFVPGPELQAAAERSVRKATTGEIDAIIVGGGDGTVHTVAGATVGHDIPLGIIPLGTLNHFAKDLNIPLSLDDAIETIAAGVYRDVDVGEVNGEIFINNSSIGVYPIWFSTGTAEGRVKGCRSGRLCSWPAYAQSAICRCGACGYVPRTGKMLFAAPAYSSATIVTT